MIRIATDVTSDLSPAQAAKYHIHLIPAWIESDTGRVRTDQITREALDHLLSTAPDLPRTMPLDEAEYDARFHDLLVEDDDTLLFISTSRHLTPVYQAVSAAAARAPQRITIIDSGGLSLYQGLQAVMAARMVARGETNLAAVIAGLRRAQERAQFVFVLNTLANLHKGGRVNLAQYMLGNVLDIKPVLTLVDGNVVPAGRARGYERALVHMQLHLLTTMKDTARPFLGVVHVNAPEQAQRVVEMLHDTLRPTQTLVAAAGPTVSVHGGPGAVGVAVCPAG